MSVLPRVEPNAAAPPLDGVRVLDFTHIVAGPFCTRILADLGAEVLHVETRSRTEGVGVHQERRDPRAHRSKKSITLNLKHEAGRATAARLAGLGDIIVENLSTDVMRRLHLDYDSLAPSNPRLIYVSMSGFGHTGPRRDWTSMNMNLQGYSGLMLATDAEGDPPISVSNSWNDFIGGLHAAFAILQALMDRKRDGRGRYLDLAQAECSIATLGPLVLSSAVNRRDAARPGNRSTSIAPQGCYPCAGDDEWCVISVQNDEQWSALTRAMGSSALATDPRFMNVLGRLRAQDEIDELIGAWTQDLHKEDVQARLEQAVGAYATAGRRTNRRGHRGAITAISGAFESADGWWMLSVPAGAERWLRFLDWVQDPVLAADPSFAQEEHREAAKDLILDRIERWSLTLKKSDAVDEAQKQHITSTPVSTPVELVDDPQLLHRGFLRDMDLPGLGTVQVPAGAIASVLGRPIGPAPSLGQHTTELLTELGYSQSDRIALFERGVI